MDSINNSSNIVCVKDWCIRVFYSPVPHVLLQRCKFSSQPCSLECSRNYSSTKPFVFSRDEILAICQDKEKLLCYPKIPRQLHKVLLYILNRALHDFSNNLATTLSESEKRYELNADIVKYQSGSKSRNCDNKHVSLANKYHSVASSSQYKIANKTVLGKAKPQAVAVEPVQNLVSQGENHPLMSHRNVALVEMQSSGRKSSKRTNRCHPSAGQSPVSFSSNLSPVAENAGNSHTQAKVRRLNDARISRIGQIMCIIDDLTPVSIRTIVSKLRFDLSAKTINRYCSSLERIGVLNRAVDGLCYVYSINPEYSATISKIREVFQLLKKFADATGGTGKINSVEALFDDE